MFFFFNDTATTEIYTLSLHDALPISVASNRAPDRSPIIQTASNFPSRSVQQAYDYVLSEGSPEYYEEFIRSEEHTSELQSQSNLVCRLLLEKKKYQRQL